MRLQCVLSNGVHPDFCAVCPKNVVCVGAQQKNCVFSVRPPRGHCAVSNMASKLKKAGKAKSGEIVQGVKIPVHKYKKFIVFSILNT